MLIYTPYGTKRFTMTGTQLKFYDNFVEKCFYLDTAPRQSGKSTFLSYMAKLYSEMGKRVLVISINQESAKSLSSMIDDSNDIHYTTYRNLNNLRGLRLTYDVVLLDEYEYFVSDRSDMYTQLLSFITHIKLYSHTKTKIFGLTTPYGNPNMTYKLNQHFMPLSN